MGLACGAFVSFLPTFGLHFVLATLLALILRGNLLAALLGTFFGNPLTFPLIAVGSMQLGSWLLGYDATMSFTQVMAAIGKASSELMSNFVTLIKGGTPHWEGLEVFFWQVFLPYTLGGTILGIPCTVVLYSLCRPIVEAYQRRRLGMIKARFEVARALEKKMLLGDGTTCASAAPAQETALRRKSEKEKQ